MSPQARARAPVAPAQKVLPRTLPRQVPNPRPQLAHRRHLPVDEESFDWDDGHDREPTPVEDVQAYVPTRQRGLSGSTVRHQSQQRPYEHRPRGGQNAQVQRDAGISTVVESAEDAISTASARHGRQQPANQALQATIEELMRERDRLAKELKNANEKVEEQQGQIDIIRENRSKEAKIADREMAALQKAMAEESLKQRAALDALAARNREIETRNRYLDHELAEEAELIKALQRRLKDASKDRPERPATATTPPRQAQADSLRDGFNDSEVMAVSPVKSTKQAKTRTPTAAGKRKRRPDNQSPIKPLVLRQGSTVASPVQQGEKSTANKAAKSGVVVQKQDRQAQRHLRLVLHTLDYQPHMSGQRITEILIKYAFPSSSSQTLASIMLDATSKLSGPDLSANFVQVFIDLWSRCMKEKYYEPVLVLISTIDYILDAQPWILNKAIVTNMLPCLTSTIHVDAFTRFTYSPLYHSNYGQFRSTPLSALNPLLPTTPPLDLLYKVACLTSSSTALHTHFWGSLPTDFVLMMLNPWQPTSDILTIFSLLSTSILPASFGNICTDASQQSQMETYILDRVCFLLWETPRVDEGLPSPTQAELTSFRLAAMTLLAELAFSSPPPYNSASHGSRILASHRSAIARIVRLLYESVATLYTFPSEPTLTPLNALINLGVKVLHHILALHGEEIDLSEKLQAVNGGIHKHRVVLTRLAFSEGWYLDQGITDETARLATVMLEDSVTPDEAEIMIKAFPGFKGRKRNMGYGKKNEEDDAEADMDVD
ncbi:hypothetical protein DV738_g296, partial [Chaetothyriales sp. CBS 135597]